MTETRLVELSAGPIEYLDSGDGPPLVFLHGAMKDAEVWREVVARLDGAYRCIRPTMPLGAHRLPMHPDADLSVAGLAALVGEFLDALEVSDVTLIQNHWGAAQIMLADGHGDRLGRLVLSACEAFDNYPPGVPARLFARAARLPGLLTALGTALRGSRFRRRYAAGDATVAHPLPADLADRWLLRFTDPAIRRDLAKVLRATYSPADKARWAAAAEHFTGPVLVVWASQDRLMPRDHGPRLAASFPRAELVEVEDSGTCIPLDRPEEFATAVLRFLKNGAFRRTVDPPPM
ncbi:alpha/beta hydrolase [Nocardia sp. CDC159]|uniref:Alpha/beta hydrolase n=1 Tax=Nocardia pulmonis TaxID=2951408 RepID=A0A9X2IW86_9NOCA|nr:MULTISPECIES: alpha/beta hydrolase [Nocardia]MCM6772585.1 alpha/beta hydrolase [Nocardia pulmonis]MCM6784757.1 alpha/beta hydrolase [Nocardia sp. CDC159]